MQKRIVIITLLVVSTFFNCKTVKIGKDTYSTTNKSVGLADIGLKKKGILKNDYNSSGIINLENPIKVSVFSRPFGNKTYEAYKEVYMDQSGVKVIYNDSMVVKPRFINVSIMDDVALLSELNNKHNSDIKSYLETNTKTSIVTGLSIAFKLEDMSALLKAETVFLVPDSDKNHVLSLYTDSKHYKNIKFSDGVVFAHRTSSPCWQEESKYQLNIVGIVDGYRSCPNKTYRSAKRAKKKINYFKL